jgi:hypothetical protein
MTTNTTDDPWVARFNDGYACLAMNASNIGGAAKGLIDDENDDATPAIPLLAVHALLQGAMLQISVGRVLGDEQSDSGSLICWRRLCADAVGILGSLNIDLARLMLSHPDRASIFLTVGLVIAKACSYFAPNVIGYVPDAPINEQSSERDSVGDTP